MSYQKKFKNKFTTKIKMQKKICLKGKLKLRVLFLPLAVLFVATLIPADVAVAVVVL